MSEKTLDNTTASQAKDNVSDIQFWGDGDAWKLLGKASSKAEGWMKSSKAYEIPGVGCMVQVTTQQRDSVVQDKGGAEAVVLGYAVAEAVTFVPGCKISETKDNDGKVIGRKLVAIGFDGVGRD